MRILGLSAFYHDSAAALVVDGRIEAAAQEERFTRRKHDAGYPANAIASCLEIGGTALADVDRVVFYDKPFVKFERLLETYVVLAPRGFRSFRRAAPVWIKEKLFQKPLLARRLRAEAPQVDWDSRLLFAEHHQSHAASAFYPSPFRRAVVLTMDGVGEWTTTSVAIGDGNDLDIVRELHFPHSLGLLYSAFTYYLGFRVNSGEYKVMGLAPYGEPKYAQMIFDELIDLKPDGTFRLDLRCFDFCTGLTMTNRHFDTLFGGPPRQENEALAQRHMDLAASVQAVVEEAVLRLTRWLRQETGIDQLCLAGGVALNCVANGKVLRDGRFRALWAQPAAGDAGGALGAALAASHRLFDAPRPQAADGGGDAMRGALLGPAFDTAAIEAALDAAGACYQRLDETGIVEAVASALAEGQAVGWFQGRMEFGPRALGNRSILADPRTPGMQRALNAKIKFRESFRPFAPSVRREDAADHFDLAGDSAYMLLVAAVRGAEEAEGEGLERLATVCSPIPAVTHVDGSARVQTVDPAVNPRFHRLLTAFKAKTGCPVLVNTSFNVRGEPIVCTPADALRCFMGTELDCLAIGDCLLHKTEQPPELARPHHASGFAPD